MRFIALVAIRCIGNGRAGRGDGTVHGGVRFLDVNALHLKGFIEFESYFDGFKFQRLGIHNAAA